MQDTIVVPNGTGAQVRINLNEALLADATMQSGATAPPITYADQSWIDTSTTPRTWRIRNEANTAWITVGTLNDTGLAFIAANSALLGGTPLSGLATSAQGVKADNALPASSYTAADVLAKMVTSSGTSNGVTVQAAGTAEACTGNSATATTATNAANATTAANATGSIGNMGSLSSNLAGTTRFLGATYTNSSGRPRVVYIGGYVASTYTTTEVLLNGVTVSNIFGYGNTTGTCFIVPNGVTYSLSNSGMTLYTWFEFS